MGKELQLDAPSQDASSSLLTPSHAIGGAVWEFYVRLEFDPSGANYLDVRIVSLTVALDGPSYFVRVGGSEDEISLYYQDEQGIDELIDGPDDMVEQAPAIARIRVERTGTGQFTLSADTSGGNNFQSIGNAYDDRLQTSSYFGFECHYTATRSDKFFFDDISVSGAPYQDSIPPKLDTLKVPGKGLIHLRFDEPLDTMGFAQADFELTPAGGFPDSIKTEGGLERIELYYPKDLPNDSQLSLNIPNISDTAGNITGSQTLQLEYLVPETPQEGGVVFNEIMADPTPSNGLPEREYLELHAADTLIQNVKEWRLWIGDDSKKLPQRILRPGDRLLVIHEGDSDLFMPPDLPILMDGLPTPANGGDS